MDLMQSLIASKLLGGGGGSSLPEVTNLDNGKALGVVEGAWDKMDIPTELPTVDATDNGKVLKVTEGAWDKADPPTELPSVTSSDKGKVLTVDSNGAWGAGNNLYEVFYAYEIGSASGRSIYFENGITEADIYNACITNKVVFIKSRDGQNATEYSNTYISTRRSSNTNYIFSATSSDRSNEIKYRFFIVNKNGQNTSTVFATNKTSLPNVDATYNGRVLTVVNGVWNQAKVPSELPTVTPSDEGKVLTVNSSGEWDAGNPGGGDIVTIQATISGTTMTLLNDVTCKDIHKLVYTDKKNVFIIATINTYVQIFSPEVINASKINFIALEYSSLSSWPSEIIDIYVCPNNLSTTLTRARYSFPLLPSAYSSDRGKVLTVNTNGSWQAMKPTKELPSVTSSDEGKVLTVNSSGQWVASTIPDGTNTSY